MQLRFFLVATVATLLSTDISAQSTGAINGHDYVDLGLSVMWATCNIGANSPEDYGDYFAWGEANPKKEYTKENCTTYGRDNITFHDAASENWGGTWRMPTLDELEELLFGCEMKFITVGDHKMMKLTSKKNSNFIILPLAGEYNGTEFNGEYAKYWSSSISEGHNKTAIYVRMAYELYRVDSSSDDRYIGKSIRPVSDGKPISATREIATINGYGFVDLGLSVNWATCDIGAWSPKDKDASLFYWGNTDGEGSYALGSQEATSQKHSMFVIDYSGDKQYDAATVNWGKDWRTPTAGEFYELFDKCESELVIQDGRKGKRFTSLKNGNSIFMPFEIIDDRSDNNSVYWSSSIYEGTEFRSCSIGYYTAQYGGEVHGICDGVDRWHGGSIRPVSDAFGKKLDHEYVDLGLSVMWATYNIGAEKPEDYGDRFAWGETQTKPEFTAKNSKYYGKNGLWHTLDAEHDAASKNWGGSWRMPTETEFRELIDNCTWEFTTSGNREGYRVKSKKNGKSIFLPATVRFGDQNCGVYWSSTAGRLISTPDGHLDVEGTTLYSGQPVRAVLEPKGNKNGHKYVDLGLSVMWATCNVGAEKPEDYGSYFAWGETQTKAEYTFENYNYNFQCYTIDKWHDVAYCTRGESWRMPTIDEWHELEENCDWEIVKIRYEPFFKFTSRKNGNTLLLHADHAPGTEPWDEDYVCEYWSSTNDPGDSRLAKYFFLTYKINEDGIKSGFVGNESVSRYLYKRIRPVAE